MIIAALASAALLAPSAKAAAGLDTVAESLRKSPVYVDPRASDQLSSSQADALASKIKKADKPVFVAVLPRAPEFPPQTLLPDLRTKAGIAGVYAVRLGSGFNAGADPRVMPHNAVVNLTAAVKRSNAGSAAAELDSFVTAALQQARGHAPSSWGGGSGSGGGGTGVAIALGVLVVAGGAGVVLLSRRNRRRRAEEERAALAKLRTVVDEDITAFGEELDRLDFDPADPAADDAMREDYTRALDSYDGAKAAMETARRPSDVRPVTERLEEGRFALATLAARRAGTPLPERRPPCFFDPRHGPSTADAEWSPSGGSPRTVPVCAADAARLADGQEPMSRTVPTENGPRPYWDAGPAYAPWAGGYFGGGLLPGLLVGTLLGGVLSGPNAYADGGGWSGPDGGDHSGADFNPDDFGGGFGGDGGGFGDGGGGGGFDGGGF
ncbi:hypothetical protein GCM10012280_19650 [Wenjunlia tyrosinilytica]|uniref:Uncharacterized protein n=1 Tax=Wenjunlia tyrosinilytica TaxID=1544741 RepID=A0A918DVQ9_9ACTN|nr:hypothetical protein GCM10012280_19650 [Wenjunlia tyrosinilytica]